MIAELTDTHIDVLIIINNQPLIEAMKIVVIYVLPVTFSEIPNTFSMVIIFHSETPSAMQI